MIKNLHRRKLSRTASHRRALLRNLATSLFLEEKLRTTVARARELASYSEHLISVARPGDITARRALAREITDEQVQKKIFEVLIPRYQDRASGITRVFRVGTRRGDRAEIALISLVS